MKLRITFLIPAALLISACATTAIPESAATTYGYRETANPGFAAIGVAATAIDKDRAAILAMQGDYRVDFHFMETVALKAGYELHDDKNTGGFETVLVVANDSDRIVLQHLLVSPGGHVIKHWRQDWVHEAKERFEFIADQSWEVRGLDVDRAAGTWTQCVFEVSDAPRYCGTGHWNHRYGVSTWTSDRSWRPLPRREYTKRDDYNVINAENRHTITPNGWTHEQDNTKTVRVGEQSTETLVREFGFNDYRNIEDYDFLPARAYWQQTSPYWARVRDAWERRLLSGSRLTISTEIDGMPIIEGTFEQADKAGDMSEDEQLEAIEALLSRWTVTQTLVSHGTAH